LGSIIDLGVGWVWYLGKRWESATLELGAVRRERDVRSAAGLRRVCGGSAAGLRRVSGGSEPDVTTRSTTYAGRVMLGWSWLIRRRVFIAVLAGVRAAARSSRVEPR
jgi:hypothetical protein